jgi:acyl-CoA reductase-like NAD-dependent aldehyde dehydrogenase
MREGKLLIDGRWRDARSGKTFETINPATGEAIAEVARGFSRWETLVSSNLQNKRRFRHLS